MKKLLYILLCLCLTACTSVSYETDSSPKNDTEETTDQETTNEEATSEETTSEETTSEETANNATTTEATAQPAITTPEIVWQGVTLSNTNNKLVIIDAGHGGEDTGATCGDLQEKNFTLTYALAIGQYLVSKGISVIYTRNGDYELAKTSYNYGGVAYNNDLTSRAALAAYYNAAIYCSIHIDSNDASSHGFSCFYNPAYQDSLDLANMILSHLSAIGYTQNRGLLDGTRLRSIRGNTTIAVMAELGFIESSDITYISNNVSTISAAIGEAIIEKLNKGWLDPDTTIVPNLS